ncbi:dual specificity phosphatase 29-like [Palaemon carinicauda]|uniref:dual specificity phosphatase 29-like n=1 Tax=Palaemon carinicauda TaxID=392227 RepID=UPI0035B5F8B8
MAGIRKVTLARDLQSVLDQIRPTPRSGLGEGMDECYPNLYVGGLVAARDKACLQKHGITHVLNTAEGNDVTAVGTGGKYYEDVNIKYLGMKLVDMPSENVARFFTVGADFIEDALSSGGKVLVHCLMGISRSATIACAFLMLKRNMCALEALTTLRKNRAIFPNEGFLQQLAELDNNLRSQRK